MLKLPDLKFLENLSAEELIKDLEVIVQDFFKEIQLFLDINPFHEKIKFILNKNLDTNSLKGKDIFSIGVNRYIDSNVVVIEFFESYIKFLPFIILREIYNLFLPKELKSYEFVQIIINQIILSDLNKSKHLNEWKSIIRENLEQTDLLTKGVNRLFAFDRLERFFKLYHQQIPNNPTQFFFKYLRRNISLISDRMKTFNEEDIHDVFFNEYTNYLSRSMNKDEIVESIRCIIYIFYKVKKYKDFLSYRKFFQNLKEIGGMDTKLSLRKLFSNINWIRRYSYISPSYQLNWNTLDVCVIAIFLSFNPKLRRTDIFKVIEESPFFISPKISYNSFNCELSGYVILPRPYLEDFTEFIRKMKSSNFIIKSYCLLRLSQNHLLNLNYFREYAQKYRIINPNHKTYNKRYEIEFQMDFGNITSSFELSLLDFLILDRIRMFSVTGFGFERNTETLATIKSDLVDEVITQQTLLTNLKKILNKFYVSENLQLQFFQFLKENVDFGFFSIKEILDEYLAILNLMDRVLAKNPKIKTLTDFHKTFKKLNQLNLVEENIRIKNTNLIDTVLNDIFSIYFESKEKYREEVEKFKNFYDLMNVFYNLKVFNLKDIKKIITDKNLVGKIYSKKEEKLEKYYEKIKLYQITSQEINNILDKLLNNEPPVIKPLLINTVMVKEYVNDFLQLFLANSQKTQRDITQIKKIFPRILVNYTKDLISNNSLIYVEISTPYLTKKEKRHLFSILHNLFKENLLYGKSFLWSGTIKALSSKNFYDFDSKTFFYTKDLYRQYFLYVRSIFGNELESRREEKNEYQEKFWSQEKSLLTLVNRVNTRVMRENNDFNDIHLKKLLRFHLNLKGYLINNVEFKKAKEEYFFDNYINSIKFIPSFENFGLEQYFIYLYPTNMNELDFKLLFLNTFQKIKYPVSIDTSNSLFIKYIMPYGSPNLKYLHWLARSKKIIREYCGFFINKVYEILHFNNNLSQEGWIYDKDRFKMHMQNVLFNSKYIVKNSVIREFEIGKKSISSYLDPESPEFESLSQIYDTQSIDIKSFLATKKVKTINHITSLLKKNLIFPYLSLKNLDLHNIVYIIVPNMKKESIDTVVKVFSFFNVATIYEIKGEYFIYGFKQQIQFPTGLMIKIKFPKCEISEFERLFDLLFEYLEVEHYIILNDLVDGSNLVKSIYGGLDFLKSYNPLKNLEWNKKQKRWENPKVFTSKFEPIYPDLVPKDNQ